ncbi:MAG: RloB domain-containing protein [Betaproteobacteria bacterium]|nr:RloB domain-containing protein [Betaproteobacteria bacterium]
MTPLKPSRLVRPTLLLVGEGETEVAFLGHLRSLYCKDGAGVEATIRNAHGKGPSHIIRKTARFAYGIAYDSRVALLDTDIPWTDQDKKLARREKIGLVGAAPCIEGLFLSILGKPVPDSPESCKAAIKKALPSFDPLERKSYAPYFSKAVLEEARNRIPDLKRLLKYLESIRT